MRHHNRGQETCDHRAEGPGLASPGAERTLVRARKEGKPSKSSPGGALPVDQGYLALTTRPAVREQEDGSSGTPGREWACSFNPEQRFRPFGDQGSL